MAVALQGIEPSGPRPQRFTASRALVYALLILAACVFLVPLYVMVVTSFKTMAEIRGGEILALPGAPTLEAWSKAWSSACTGLNCGGIRVGFWNSVTILVPSVIVSIFAGALNGYALAFWRVPGAQVLFTLLVVGAFIPYQIGRAHV